MFTHARWRLPNPRGERLPSSLVANGCVLMLVFQVKQARAAAGALGDQAHTFIVSLLCVCVCVFQLERWLTTAGGWRGVGLSTPFCFRHN